MKKLSKFLAIMALFALSTAVLTNCGNSNQKKEDMTEQFKEFLKNYESKVIPLYKESSLAYWNASISGKPEDWAKCEKFQIQLNEIFANKEEFAKLKKIVESNSVNDELLKRQLEVIYNAFLGSQVDTAKLNAMTKMQTEIEKKYGNFRAEFKGKKLSDNDVETFLKTSTNTEELKGVWTAQKKIGSVVAADIIKLVKKRNEVAKELGFNNYHEMSLKLSEQDPAEISKLFDQLDSLTREAFAQQKNEIDEFFTKRYKVKPEELMPWHYQNRFFQEGPKIYKVDFDVYYKGKDLAKLTEDFYAGIGIEVADIMKKSDLFEKPGKNQHAYCIDIDNKGDIRVLCNVQPTEEWMGTMLHEFGHASYDKYIEKSLPFSLQNPAHTFTTEAIAMLFGRLSRNAEWMKAMLNISESDKVKIAEISFKALKMQQLVFSRWAQVMYRFEKSLYENPDQDLNKLWWDLVEKYQLLKRPEGRNEPDWASKIHIATSPCYYHNYLLGELLASQLNHYICKNILKTDDLKNPNYVNNKEIGKFLVEKVFSPGAKFKWNEMIEKATGEKLTPKYYADQFVK